MSYWCKDDVSTGDAQRMSNVKVRVMLVTGFYSVGDRATEVFPDWMKDRINRRVSSRVDISEVIVYGVSGLTRAVKGTRIVCKGVGKHGKLFGTISFLDCKVLVATIEA